jgi:hypothetical protein
MQLFRCDQAQNPVAEEFQALVRRAGIGAGMRQCAFEQCAVVESMTEPRLQISR